METSESFKCDKCDAEFASRRSLIGHRRKHTTKVQPKIKCPLCNRECAGPAALTTHMTKHATSLPAKAARRSTVGFRGTGVLSGLDAL